jgi:hypothetical protein
MTYLLNIIRLIYSVYLFLDFDDNKKKEKKNVLYTNDISMSHFAYILRDIESVNHP